MYKLFLNKILLFCITIAFILRIYLGEIVGIWFPSEQVYDDALLVAYALPEHYSTPDHLTLLKTMSYPWFLNFVDLVNLPYTVVISFIWCLSALLIFNLSLIIIKNKYIAFFSFLYILFLPTAFEIWMGTRLYRNSILVPFVMMNFYFMVYNIYALYKNIKTNKLYSFMSSTLFGILFSFTYYIKEDGIWLLACMIAYIVIYTLIMLIKFIFNREILSYNLFFNILTLFFPILIFIASSYIYKDMNYRITGVKAIETRTQSELGDFVKKIYKISSKTRNSIHWAPADAIDAAYKVSSTFQKYPELRNKIIHTPWFSNDIYIDPIRGDFLTWVLRTALTEANIWKTEKQVNDLFREINKELEQAFNNGSLKKENERMQLVSSMGGRNWSEINDLIPLVGKIYRGTIFLKGYSAGSVPGNITNLYISHKAAELTNIQYLANPQVMENGIVDHSRANNIVNIIFSLYKTINFILFFMSIGIIVYMVFLFILNSKAIKEKFIFYKDSFVFLTISLSFLMLSFVYSLAIAWFSEFIFKDGVNMTILNFYSVINSGLMSFFYMFGLFTFISLFRLRNI